MSGFEIEKEYLLEKFTGKGAWTYALIPEIAQNKNNPFGWVSVSGYIDNYELNNYKLMPFGQGILFLPLSAKVRKLIKKEAGDRVLIKLNVLTIPDKLSAEVIECLNNESFLWINIATLGVIEALFRKCLFIIGYVNSLFQSLFYIKQFLVFGFVKFNSQRAEG